MIPPGHAVQVLQESSFMHAHRALDLQAALRKVERWKTNLESSRMRRFVRFTSRGEARLWPGRPCNNPGAVTTVHIRDISRGGVGVLSNYAATPGTLWQVQIGDQDVVIGTLPGFCRYCIPIMEGAYLIGIQFGIDTSVLLSLGVPAKSLAIGDLPDEFREVAGEFHAPEEHATQPALA
jgi:hypothetical protein